MFRAKSKIIIKCVNPQDPNVLHTKIVIAVKKYKKRRSRKVFMYVYALQFERLK